MKATEQRIAPTEAAIAERDQLLRALDGAPTKPGPINADLRGWWTPQGWYLCATCAGRILARGCRLQATPVWKETAEPYGVCVGCKSPAPTKTEAKRIEIDYRFYRGTPTYFMRETVSGRAIITTEKLTGNWQERVFPGADPIHVWAWSLEGMAGPAFWWSELTGPDGARYHLAFLPDVDAETIAAVKKEIKNQHDVTGFTVFRNVIDTRTPATEEA